MVLVFVVELLEAVPHFVIDVLVSLLNVDLFMLAEGVLVANHFSGEEDDQVPNLFLRRVIITTVGILLPHKNDAV